MVSTRRLKETFAAYRRLITSSWNLFKESRIGVMGLAVIIAFFVMALAAPYMNLRDPIRFTAPAEDRVVVSAYWDPPVSSEVPGSVLIGMGTVNKSMAFRVAPDTFGSSADRVFVAGGDPGDARLYALHSSRRSSPAWKTERGNFFVPLSGASPGYVSANPVVINYGSFECRGGELPSFIIYVGMSDGTLIALEDSFDPLQCFQAQKWLDRTVQPLLTEGWTYQVDGAITGIAAYTPDLFEGRVGRERVAVSTDAGKVYIFRINATGTGHRDPVIWTAPGAGSGNGAFIADGPMRGLTKATMWSPAFDSKGETLAVGTTDGTLYLVNAVTGGELWNLTVVEEGDWRAAPIIGDTSNTPPHNGREIVYAAGKEGVVMTRYLAGPDAIIAGWDTAEPPVSLGYTIVNKTAIETDPGEFNQPAIFGQNIYLSSTSGHIYGVRRDGIGEAGPGSVQWVFEDPTLTGLEPMFVASPIIIEQTDSVLIGARTLPEVGATEHTAGVFYSIRRDTADVNYQIAFKNETIEARAISWTDPENIGDGVWFPSTPDSGGALILAYDSTGVVTTPSEPSWAREYETDNLQDCGAPRCPGYPSGNTYILGLDAWGRDIFAQLVWGSRIALLVGFLAAFFTVLIGTIIGLVAGYLGGRVDSVLMRFTDVILVIPGLPLIIILAAVLGASIWNIILIIALIGWPGIARIIRAEVLSLKERPFVESARVTGASSTRIMFRHIAPNVMPLAFLFATFAVSGAILTEAALSFIGLGDVDTMSWGIMLFYVQQSDALRAWWWLLPPGLAITLLSLAFFLVGRAFDEIVNPRLRRR
jgi:peptide/nickel transport system permease protein